MAQQKAAGAGESHGAAGIDPVLLARKHKEKGFTAAYVPQIDAKDTALVMATREAFQKEGVMLSEAGYWENIMDTEAESRAYHRNRQLDSLYLAEEIGAVCSVNIFGSYCHGNGNSQHKALNFTDEAFEAAVEMARYFLDTVKPKTAFFTYEIFPFDITDSVENIERLIKAVDRKQFGVHLDLVNLINCPRAYFSSGDIAKECVRRFGDRIVSCHAKDIKMKEPSISVILEEVLMGQGNIDLKTFMRQIEGLSRPIPFMLEHLKTEAEYDSAAEYVRKTGKELGINL
ncbi:xylose isomerase domain protein TIM barrel [Leadbettera azotonutricia ZAS-9]|uniref:Xylose isomerase domain protein TIM barrel n=2 Tax=Leadbettera azotonutricia TaxID=150829 RepID=F5YCC1_LEAAZ|nr:xylose isomerase domain protein TIM barrel [Leadbettera azotonutricia ZAS-9]